MKYLLTLITVILLLLLLLTGQASSAKTPQQVLKEEGYHLLSKINGKEVYYRPKEVKRANGFVYYSTTTFYTNGAKKYALESNYKALACKEKKVIHLSVHKVPYVGKSSYTDLTKKGIKSSDIKSITGIDQQVKAKVC